MALSQNGRWHHSCPRRVYDLGSETHHMAHIENTLPWWLSGKESACLCRRRRPDPGSGRSRGEGNGNPLRYQKKKKRKYPFVVSLVQFSSVQMISCVWLFGTPWTAARQASLFFTISQSLLKLMSIELVMPSNHLVLHHPLLLPSIFPSIRVFPSELTSHQVA